MKKLIACVDSGFERDVSDVNADTGVLANHFSEFVVAHLTVENHLQSAESVAFQHAVADQDIELVMFFYRHLVAVRNQLQYFAKIGANFCKEEKSVLTAFKTASV